MVIHIVTYHPRLTDLLVLLFIYQNVGLFKNWQCQTKEKRDYYAAKSVPEISTFCVFDLDDEPHLLFFDCRRVPEKGDSAGTDKWGYFRFYFS